MRNITLISALLATALLIGCGPDVSGSWAIEVIDGADTMEGDMYLDVRDGDVNGSLDLELFSGCGDLHGDVDGDVDGESISLEVDFEDWRCDGYVFDFYDIEIPSAQLYVQGVEAIEIDGDGDWGEAEIRFVAER